MTLAAHTGWMSVNSTLKSTFWKSVSSLVLIWKLNCWLPDIIYMLLIDIQANTCIFLIVWLYQFKSLFSMRCSHHRVYCLHLVHSKHLVTWTYSNICTAHPHAAHFHALPETAADYGRARRWTTWGFDYVRLLQGLKLQLEQRMRR